jgi:predicted PurR-regulated permease PerM
MTIPPTPGPPPPRRDVPATGGDGSLVQARVPEGSADRGSDLPVPVGTDRATPGPGPSVWSDALGRAGARAAQILLIAALIASLVWLLLRVSLVVVAVLVALILASAAYPLVRWLVRRRWSRLLATAAVFLGILVLLGSVVTGIVFAVRGEWDALTASANTGWEELQRYATSGPLPIDTEAVDAALQRATDFVTSGAFIGGFVPIVGAMVAGALAALVALVTTGPLASLIVVAIMIAVSRLEGDVLQPLVMGRTLSLHALVVLLALTAGTLVGGLFGAILAVPLTAVAWAVIQVWTDRYQSGEDPILGADPLAPKDHVAAKASVAQRWKYQRMCRQGHRNGTSRPVQKTATDHEGPHAPPTR